MRFMVSGAKRVLSRYDNFTHLRDHISQASDKTITMCMNKHLLRGATMKELLELAAVDNRRLHSNDFRDESRIKHHIRWCRDPKRGWMVEQNRHGVYRIVGYRGERDKRVDSEHAVQRSYRGQSS